MNVFSLFITEKNGNELEMTAAEVFLQSLLFCLLSFGPPVWGSFSPR